MTHTHLRRFTVAMALVSGGYAHAEGLKTEEMLAMISSIEFIAQNSPLEYAGQSLPEVVVVTEEELQRRFLLSEGPAAAIRNDRSLGVVSALYDRQANMILLVDVNAIAGPGLFHEMVHFLQNINDKYDMFTSHRVCLEAEAYEMQAIWQTEQGIDLASKPEYGFVMTLYGACNDADFSWIESPYQG